MRAVTIAEYRRWLKGITPTKPFTFGDAGELQAMIRSALGPSAKVEVYTQRGDEVFITVWGFGEPVKDVLDVV